MNTCFIVALLGLFLTESLIAADASGVWSLRLTTADGETAPRTTVTQTQKGTTLTGTCVIEDTDTTFTVTGQVAGDVVTWRCGSNGPVEASFKGTINSTGREITGSWTTPAPAKGTFKGSRKQE